MLRSALLVLVVLGVSSRPSLADDLRASHGQDLREMQHSVELQVVGSDVIYTVQRSFSNRSERVEEAALTIELPAGAVASDLRVQLGETWFAGQLMTAQEADTLYRHLSETGPVGARGPALLSFQDQRTLELKIFPIPAESYVLVEYRLRVPACYHKGMLYAQYPRSPAGDDKAGSLRPARLHAASDLRASWQPSEKTLPAALAEIRSACLQGSEWLDDFEDQDLVFIEHEVASPIVARLGTHVLGEGRLLAELTIDVAASLSELPRNAELVFVVDTSFSMSPAALQAQLTLIEAYLSHLPDAEFEIVFYQRHARRAFGRMRSAREAKVLLSQLRGHPPARGNGSNLDAGLALAGRSLSGRADRAQRILAMTDSRFRSALDADAVRAALASAPRALVHVIDVEPSGAILEYYRDDEHPLASAVASTGGMVVNMVGHGPVAEVARAVLGLVRPIGVDSFALEESGTGEPTDAFGELAETAPEGLGHRSLVFWRRASALVVRGKIWGRSIRVPVVLDHNMSAQVPALVFGRDLSTGLAPADQRLLAQAGHVVSPVTSLLARDPRAPPSSYDDDDAVLTGMLHGSNSSSMSGTSCGGVLGYGKRGLRPEPPDFATALASLLAADVLTCEAVHGGDGSAVLEVETTGNEIVNVGYQGTSSPLRDCLAEAAWELRLGDFFATSHGLYRVAL